MEVLDKLSKDGVRVEMAFDDRTILRFMLYGCAAAVVAAVLVEMVRKKFLV